MSGFCQICRYLGLCVAKIPKAVKHYGTLILGKVLALIAHHLLHKLFLLAGVAWQENGLNAAYVGTLLNGSQCCAKSALSVHQPVTLRAICGFGGYNGYGV